jgi:bifunctional UDP-N-acetylglucosamine pyrophosphorylase/glucosamine-1-phosphate N-acetyltransferase
MLDHVVDACRKAGVARVVVVVNPAQPEVAEHVAGRCEVVFQSDPRGTGHALLQTPEDVFASADLLVLNGDAPLIRADTITRLVDARRGSEAAAALATVIDPGRRDGRVIRSSDGSLERIVEAKDATSAEISVAEFNVGAYCFDAGRLLPALHELRPDNRARELYLTDVFRALRPVVLVELEDAAEALGVNDRIQLARAGDALRRRVLEVLMVGGVTVTDPATTWVDATVEVGEDTVIEPFTRLLGRTTVGRDCVVGPGSEIRDSYLGDGCEVRVAWLEGCSIGDGSDCGPYAKIRAGSELGTRVHIGSFGEIVRSSIGSGTRMGHFSYIGDATVGRDVNIGAGAVTANYDGSRKHRTVIGDGAFIGVDTMLRAPVRVGRGSRTGAGAIVTRDVPDGETAVGMPARVLRREVEA